MKAQELRIGNYYNPSSPKQIEAYDFMNMVENDLDYPPIPLTAEWLEKFRFQKSEGTEFIEWSAEKSFILQDKNKDYYYPYGSTINIQYVHQLQNLYFALTGEELTIKSPALT